MEDYSLEEFREDIRTNREFEFKFNDKMYSLTYSKQGFIFTDVNKELYQVYQTYYDLLKNVRIGGYSIEEIIANNMYKDLYIY